MIFLQFNVIVTFSGIAKKRSWASSTKFVAERLKANLRVQMQELIDSKSLFDILSAPKFSDRCNTSAPPRKDC